MIRKVYVLAVENEYQSMHVDNVRYEVARKMISRNLDLLLMYDGNATGRVNLRASGESLAATIEDTVRTLLNVPTSVEVVL